MKTDEAVNEAISIGNDSWELISFMGLPKNASKEKQIAALKSDQTWQRNHIEMISSQIDDLIQQIEI